MNLINKKFYDAFMFIVLLTVGITLSVILKNDFLWDFANYHYYNAWAFLNGRLNYDIAPASLNTFFNPIIDLPLYFYIRYFNDHLNCIYALQGIWAGLLLFVFYKIYILFFELKNAKDYVLLFTALLFSVSGSATFHQIGASTNEMPVAFFFLWGFYILLKMIKFPETQNLKKFLLAGLIMGIGLGLKQTIVAYCIASGLALIIYPKCLNKPLKSICFFALGGLTGYLIINGYFMWQYWEAYGNPFFPFLNGIFHSPYFDDFNYTDKRFLPTIKEFFLYPFLWNLPQYRIAVVPILNLRLSLFYPLMIIGFLLSFTKNKRQTSTPEKVLFIFLFLAFLIWMAMFSIMRYAVIIEVLSAIIFIQILDYLVFKAEYAIPASIFATMLIVILLSPIIDKGWGKRDKEDTKFIAMENINLPPNTLLQLYNFPSAFVVPLFAAKTNLRALGYYQYNCTYMKGSDFLERGKFNQIRQDIEKEHVGPKVIIFMNNTFLRDTNISEAKKRISYCRQTDSCVLNYCETEKYIEDIILHIPNDYVCKHLKNNIVKRLTICVPEELKTQIFGKEDSPEKEENK